MGLQGVGHRQRGVGVVGAVLLCVLVVVGVFALSGNSARTGSAAQSDPQAGLRGACKEFVGRALHDPASADWGEYWNWTVVDNHDSTYSVGARYRAKNGFGAVRAAYTTCVLRRSGGDIMLIQLSQMK